MTDSPIFFLNNEIIDIRWFPLAAIAQVENFHQNIGLPVNKCFYKNRTLTGWVQNEESSFEGGFRFVLWVVFCTKTKTLAKFVENRKYDRSPLLLQVRIIFDLFSSDFKTILKGSSFLGLPSSFCTRATLTGERKRNNE